MGGDDLDALDMRCDLGDLVQTIVEVVTESVRDLQVTAGDDNVHEILLDT